MNDMKWLEEIERSTEIKKERNGYCVMSIKDSVQQTELLTKALRVAIGALEKSAITLTNCDQHCLSATRANDDAVKALAEIERIGRDDDV